MKKHHLPPIIGTPCGYRRHFIFRDTRSKFREEIVVDCNGITITTFGRPGRKLTSQCLDWIEESVGGVRKELGI
jgi:hypothetical protein